MPAAPYQIGCKCEEQNCRRKSKQQPGSFHLPPNQDGSAMSRIVRSPAGAVITLGIEFTVIDAVATSPWTPPVIFCSMRGTPSIDHRVVALRARRGTPPCAA